MQVFHGYRGLPEGGRGAAVALGNFDGVHRGHQAVIAAAAQAVPEAPLGVVTFDPHPRAFFQPETPPFVLTPPPEKARKLEAAGADLLYILRFDEALSGMPPDLFAREVLADGLGVRAVAVGADFRFGAKRAGDAAVLRSLGETLGFAVATLGDVADEDGAAFSSSAVRAALRDGLPQEATAILGEPHRIVGVVTEGDRRGRTIGFPTLNLSLDGVLAPAFGVYAVTVETPQGWIPGVANIGLRPTFAKTVAILEAHLFDFDGDLYGTEIVVALHHYLREERKFDGIDALKAQITADAAEARRLLAG